MSEMATVDVNPAESSPAAEPASALPLSELTPTERQEWRKTGHKPTRAAKPSTSTDSTPNAASSTAAPADPATGTPVSDAPASEPGTPTRKKTDAKTRIPELDAEIQERLSRRRQLDQEIAEHEARLRQVKPQAEVPPPAVSVATDRFPEFEDWLVQPGNETKGLGAYTDAAVEFKLAQQSAKSQVEQAKRQRMEQYVARFQADVKDEPDWASKVAPELLALQPADQLGPGQALTMGHVLAQEVLHVPNPYAVLRYLTDHATERQQILAYRGPAADVIRHIGMLSARLSLPSGAPAPSVPAVKTTTDAPAPPPEIGRRAQSPDVDDLLAASRSGDPRRYRETANAIDIARMRANGR